MTIIKELAAAIFDSGKKPVTAAIEQGYETRSMGLTGTSAVSFQYFPERITDSKTANYASKEIPGGSHPIYTFVSGGERVISFDAIFCNDSDGEGAIGTGLLGSVLNALMGGGGSKINNQDRKDVVDIAAALNFLSALMYPIYKDNISNPPPLSVIYLPKSGIMAADGILDSFVGILTSRNITYESFHRNGTPRIAVVSLEFREFIQTSDTWQFVNSDDLMDSRKGRGRDYDKPHQAS